MNQVGQERIKLSKDTEVLIEAATFVGSQTGALLVAGQNNYIFQSLGGAWKRTETDSVLGVVLRGRDIALVRAPISNTLLAEPRAVQLEDGRWAVAFAELESAGGPRTASALWFGILHGTRWLELERVALPAGEHVSVGTVAAPVVSSRSLFWALRLNDSPGILIVEKRWNRQGWSKEISPLNAVYPQVVMSDSKGLILVAVHADPNVNRDHSSLFLWSRDSTWQVLKKTASGLQARVHYPEVQLGRGSEFATWLAQIPDSTGGTRFEARLVREPLGPSNPRALVLDSSVNFVSRVQRIDAASGEVLWVVEHLANGRRAIRVVQQIGEYVVRLAEIGNSYHTSGIRAATTPDGFAVVGTVVSGEPRSRTVVSVLTRFRVECTEHSRVEA